MGQTELRLFYDFKTHQCCRDDLRASLKLKMTFKTSSYRYHPGCEQTFTISMKRMHLKLLLDSQENI